MTDLADRRGVETDVYRPAEDSALLLRAALDGIESTDLVLDLGTGSGFVGDRIAMETGATVVASDRNPLACAAARDRGLPVVRADLVEPFAPETFDVVVFNPPYLPEDDRGIRDDWMEVALTGGETGRAVIDPFLRTVDRVLDPEGVVYLLASTLSGLDAVRSLAHEAGFVVDELDRESYPFEKLVVWRLE
ncbi:MAG: HemK2/MTQ2 family protein methyltransferase [Halodesulfurarchaeum sp.]